MPIIRLIKFLIKDTISDIKFVADVLNGKRKIKFTKEQIEELKDWKGMLKENWIFFLIVISAFCCGFFISQVITNNACVEAVTKWVIENPPIQGINSINDTISNIFNIT